MRAAFSVWRITRRPFSTPNRADGYSLQSIHRTGLQRLGISGSKRAAQVVRI
jgi:hypothetical protein